MLTAGLNCQKWQHCGTSKLDQENGRPTAPSSVDKNQARAAATPFRAQFLAVVIRAVSPWANISTRTLSLTLSSARLMARSSLSTRPVRQVAAPVPLASPHRVRRWDRTPTQILSFTASCVRRSQLHLHEFKRPISRRLFSTYCR
jgi:hypothetical protein